MSSTCSFAAKLAARRITLLVRAVAEDPGHPLAFAAAAPGAFAAALEAVVRDGWSFAPLEDLALARRCLVVAFERPWRDALAAALPHLRAHNAPFVIFDPDPPADGAPCLAMELEAALARLDFVEINLRAEMIEEPARTRREKRRALRRLLADLAARPYDDAWDVVSRLVARAGLEPGFSALLRPSADEMAALAADPLCEIRRGVSPAEAGLPIVALSGAPRRSLWRWPFGARAALERTLARAVASTKSD